MLHSEKIGVLTRPNHFTKDWALIKLYEEKIYWSSFEGNRVYIDMFIYIHLFFYLLSGSSLVTFSICCSPSITFLFSTGGW